MGVKLRITDPGMRDVFCSTHLKVLAAKKHISHHDLGRHCAQGERWHNVWCTGSAAVSPNVLASVVWCVPSTRGCVRGRCDSATAGTTSRRPSWFSGKASPPCSTDSQTALSDQGRRTSDIMHGAYSFKDRGSGSQVSTIPCSTDSHSSWHMVNALMISSVLALRSWSWSWFNDDSFDSAYHGSVGERTALELALKLEWAGGWGSPPPPSSS